VLFILIFLLSLYTKYTESIIILIVIRIIMTFSKTIRIIRLCILKKQNSLLTFIVVILGMVPIACKYGSPSATYILNGTVKSRVTNQPIEKIKVSHYTSAVFTDNLGYFTLSFTNNGDGKILEYKLQDIDTTVSGRFKDKDTLISFEGVTFTGGRDKWDEGTGEKNVEIYLEPK
jgi:putative lipoprotein (rSAM/lipoprotein system)